MSRLALVRPEPVDDMTPVVVETEEAIIGALLMDIEALDTIARYLRPEHFLNPSAAAVYACILDMAAAGGLVDYLTVAFTLEAAGQLGPIGGSAQLTAYVLRCPVWHHIEAYARNIRRAAMRRETIEAAGDIATAAWETPDPSDVDGLIAYSRSRLEILDTDVSLGETGAVDEALTALRMPRPGGWSTGVAMIDDMLGGYGLTPKTVTCIAGPTGVGKTWLVMTWIREALEAGAVVADFSLEMSKHARLVRLAASCHYFGAAALRLMADPATWTDDDRRVDREIGEWVATFGNRYGLFDSQRELGSIIALARVAGADVVAIDYYQNIARPRGARDDNDADRVNSLAIERAAQAGNSAFVVVSQMDQAAVREITGGIRSQNSTMRWGKELGYRCDNEIVISRDKDSTPETTLMRIEPRKARHARGFAERADDDMRFRMNKATGRIAPFRDPLSAVPS